MERSIILLGRHSSRQCALMIIADGFEEITTIVTISALRQAGLCIKSVGLTSSFVNGAHGVEVMPDLSITDFPQLINTTPINLVILPEGKQALARLETDPRVHQLLRQVVAQQGQVVTTAEGLGVLRAAAVWLKEFPERDGDHQGMPVYLYDQKKSPETLAQDLIRRFKEMPTS